MLNTLDSYDKSGTQALDIRFQGTKLFGFHVADLPDPAQISVNVYIPQQKRWTAASVKRADTAQTTVLTNTLEKLAETYVKYRAEVNDPVFWVQQVLKKDVGRVEQGLKFAA